MKINYAAAEAAAAELRGCACPPLSALAQDFPSLFTFALSVCLCLCVCSRKFAFSLFGKPNSEAYLLRKCSDHLTKTQRTRRNGVSCISYVIESVVIRLLNNIFHSFALPIKYIFIIIAKYSFNNSGFDIRQST